MSSSNVNERAVLGGHSGALRIDDSIHSAIDVNGNVALLTFHSGSASDLVLSTGHSDTGIVRTGVRNTGERLAWWLAIFARYYLSS